MNQNPTHEATTATHNSKEPTMSTVNPTEQAMPTAADPAITTSPAEPADTNETSHDDPNPLAGHPCAEKRSAVDSDDIDEEERSVDAGVAYRVVVIGIAAILVVVALVGRRRRRTGVSP